MKVSKMLGYDLKNGCFKNLKLILLPIVFEMGVLFLISQKINEYKMYSANVQISVGDIIFYHFGGMAKYILSAEKVFEFPVIWMVFFVIILFATLSYPNSNLQGFGNKILVKGQSRIKWWLVKCVWNMICNLILFFLIFIIVFAFCQINSIPFHMQVNGELQSVLFQLDANTRLASKTTMPFTELLLIFMTSVAICQLQMLLDLWIKPIYSFLCMCALLLVSAYFQSNLMIGNYAMLIRHSWINEQGINCNVGILVLAILIVLSVIIGVIRFRNYDIIQEDK